jgi:hypothetical protein
MKPVSLFILWFLGFFLIVLLCLRWHSSAIEDELVQKTRYALANSRLESVIPVANGQTMILTGHVISDKMRQQAEAVTIAINGVIAVNNRLTITSVNKAIQQTPQALQTPPIANLPNKTPSTVTSPLKTQNQPTSNHYRYSPNTIEAPISPKVPVTPIAPVDPIAPQAPIPPIEPAKILHRQPSH